MPDIAVVAWPNGKKNIGGIDETILFAVASDFTTAPAMPSAPASQAAMAVISVDPVFASGKGWKPIYNTMLKGEVKSKLVGEFDGKSYEHDLAFSCPGTETDNLGFASLAPNSGFFFLIKQNDGKYRIMGVEHLAKMKDAEEGTGMKNSDEKGIKYTFFSFGSTPVPLYTGAIDLE
jgi:hypothetical protein